MILAAASITHPGFVPQNFQVFLLTVFIMVIQSFISSMPTKWIANFNSVGSTFNILALVIVIVVIPSATNRADQGMPKFNPASEVWGNFYQGTSFPNGVALLMSFVAVIWTMRYDNDAPASGKLPELKRSQWLRRSLPFERGMFQCQHCLASGHCAHQRGRWTVWLVPATGGRLHSGRYRCCLGIGSRPAIRGVSAAGPAAKCHLDHPRSDHHVRLFHGSRVHGLTQWSTWKGDQANGYIRWLLPESHSHTRVTTASDHCRALLNE